MKPKTIFYRKLKNTGNYENETVGLEAEIEKGETTESALAKVKEWVDGELKRREEAKMTSQIEYLREEKQKLQTELAPLREQKWFAEALESLSLTAKQVSDKANTFAHPKEPNVVPSDDEEAEFDENEDED